MKHQRLRERVEAEKLKVLQDRPCINKKSQQIIKNKRLNQGSFIAYAVQHSPREEIKSSRNKSPGARMNQLTPDNTYKEVLLKQEKSDSFISQSSVELNRAFEYKKILESRKNQI